MSYRDSSGWIACGAVLGGLAVVLGAFAAHGLEDRLLGLYDGQTKQVLGETVPSARKYLADFQTAAEYQMSHALAMILLGLTPCAGRRRAAGIAGWCFLFGILLFSGSLYVLVLTGITKLGMITPIGGVLFLVGWAAFAWAAWPRPDRSPSQGIAGGFDMDDTQVVPPRRP